MDDLYSNIAEIYDECSVNDFSVSFGNAMLKYFNGMHSNETFKKNLDICCGTGTLCGFFKENNIETKGVDISSAMLKVARNKYPNIEFIEADVVKYQDDETYDFVTCIDDAFNHIVDVDDAKKVIKNIYKLLRVNGLFILDINNFNLLPTGEYNKSSNDYSRLVYKLHKEEDLFKTHVEYYEHEKLVWKNSVVERNYSIDDLTQMFNEEGFVLESCSQHLFEEKRCAKWKFIFKKIE